MSLKNESCESQYDGSSMEEFSVGAMLPIVPLNSEKKENSLSDTSIEELIDNTNKEADKNGKKGIDLSDDSTFGSLTMTLVEKSEKEEYDCNKESSSDKKTLDKDITFSKSFSDVKNIVNSLSEKDLNRICNGEFKNSPYVLYREILLYKKEPAAFVDVYKLPHMKEDGVIVLAAKEKFRGKGFTGILVKRMKDKLKDKNLTWKTQKDNESSIKLAKKMDYEPVYESSNLNAIELAVDSTFKSLEMNLVEKTEEEEEEFDGVIVEGYCFFEEDVDWFEESTKEIDEDIKEVIDTLNKKGYTTKYSCSGHPSGRFKKDRYRDGILHKKLYSTARIVFAKDYDLPTVPKYWELKVLDEDKTAIYVKPPTYKITDGLPVESFNKWKKKYMDSLRKWADKLPKEGEKPEEKEAVTLESVIDDIMIDLF